LNEPTRNSIDVLLTQGDQNAAIAQMRFLYFGDPNIGNAQFILERAPRIAGRSLTPCRIAFLRSFTIEPVLPLLKASAVLYGLEATTWIAPFNAYVQEILRPDSDLYRFEPSVIVLAIQTCDLLPDIWSRFADLSNSDVDAILAAALDDLRSWISGIRTNSQASLIIHNMELPAWSSQGVLDCQDHGGQIFAIKKFNADIQTLASEATGVYLLDYDGLTARFGRDRWHDEHKWLTVRMPIAADALHFMADEYVRFLLPLMGCTCKALVVDLDNTLWGGVVGEDGVHGIRIGAEYPGAAYQQLQRAILDLYQRGIILAICSKNNLEDAVEVFDTREEMILKKHHFAAMRINWQDKAQNLREIAAELNIGLESLAFLDDNPAERQRIQTELPEVTVLDITNNPMQYTAILRRCPVLERLSLSAEDRERGRYYSAQRQRQDLQESTGTVEGYLRSLQMEAQFELVTPANISRIAQLTQKTNQFNLTTRRYSEQQILEIANCAGWDVVGLAIRDRFGDNGLVGVAVLCRKGEMCEIDTLLLSCRVIGRTVESALLAYLADTAIRSGAKRLCGWFFPTKKNAPAQRFYPDHGFNCIAENENGALWELDLIAKTIQSPAWIVCRQTEGVHE
jgi:FkbH-like protein